MRHRNRPQLLLGFRERDVQHGLAVSGPLHQVLQRQRCLSRSGYALNEIQAPASQTSRQDVVEARDAGRRNRARVDLGQRLSHTCSPQREYQSMFVASRGARSSAELEPCQNPRETWWLMKATENHPADRVARKPHNLGARTGRLRHHASLGDTSREGFSISSEGPHGVGRRPGDGRRGGEEGALSGRRSFDGGRMGRGNCRATRICCLPRRLLPSQRLHGLGFLGFLRQLIHLLRQVVHIGFLDQVSDLLRGHGAFDLQVRSDIAEKLDTAVISRSASRSICRSRCARLSACRASRFWLARTNSARKMASSDTVIVRKGNGNGSNVLTPGTKPVFAAIQKANHTT